MYNYRQQLKKMETLVSKCEQTEAVFRAIKTKLEILSRSEVVEQLLCQIELDLEVVAKSIKIAREAMKQTRLLVNNPCEITEADAQRLYEAAW